MEGLQASKAFDKPESPSLMHYPGASSRQAGRMRDGERRLELDLCYSRSTLTDTFQASQGASPPPVHCQETSM